jgi:hypothetical protein
MSSTATRLWYSQSVKIEKAVAFRFGKRYRDHVVLDSPVVSTEGTLDRLTGGALLVLSALHTFVMEIIAAVSSTICKLLDPRLEPLGADVTVGIVVEAFALRLELLAEELRLVAQEILMDCKVFAVSDLDANGLSAESTQRLAVEIYIF